MRICSVEGCGRKHRSNGLCNKHRQAKAVAQNPDRYASYWRKYARANRDFKARKTAAWRLADPNRAKTSAAASYRRHRDKRLAYSKSRIAELASYHLAHLLGLGVSDVPPELLKAKRASLKLKRLIKQMEKK